MWTHAASRSIGARRRAGSTASIKACTRWATRTSRRRDSLLLPLRRASPTLRSQSSRGGRAGRVPPVDGGDIEVTIPAPTPRSAHPGIQVHRSSLDDQGRSDGPGRHLGDQRRVDRWSRSLRFFRRMSSEQHVREALGMQLVSIRSLLALLERLGPSARRAKPEAHSCASATDALGARGGRLRPDHRRRLRAARGERAASTRRAHGHPRLPLAGAETRDRSRWRPLARQRARPSATMRSAKRLLERHGDTVLRIRWERGDTAAARFGAEALRPMPARPFTNAEAQAKIADTATNSSLGARCCPGGPLRLALA